MLIAGNWKMYKGQAETAEFCIELKRALADLEAVEVAVCPPFPSLAVAVQILAGTDIAVAAQNVHWEAEGPFTGEVSAPMLRELGVYGAIVGHSERRQLFGETDEGVGRRTRAALDAALSVIACVGETEEERERGETEDVLRRQLSVLEAEDNLVIAYEPVWAIGTGKTATPEIAQEKGTSSSGAARRPRALRWLREAGERRGAPEPAGRRRRARRRRLARRRLVCLHLPERKPLVALVILDGWGLAPPGPGNAVELADTPVFDRLWNEYPHTTLKASGEAVGLPPGQMGNSEVGHLTIGSGRVLFQDLMRVNQAIADGSLFENPALVGAFERARARGGRVHLLGLVSYGGVHSHIDHVRALLELARRQGMEDQTFIHAFTDGRDVSPTSAADDLAELPVDRIATVVGRYYAMDRDQRWERTEKALTGCIDPSNGDDERSDRGHSPKL